MGHAFSLWQREGLGHPVFVSDGAWHPLKLALKLSRVSEYAIGPVVGAFVGTVVAAIGAALCIFLLLGPEWAARRRLAAALLAAIVLALQPYGVALVAFGIASAAYGIRRYVAAPSPWRWVAAVVAAILGMLSTSSITLPWMIIVVICAVVFIATAGSRRAESALGVVGILATSTWLASPWWLPALVIGQERAPAALERGALRDDGEWRSLDLGRFAETTFSSDRLARLRPLAIAPSGAWRLGAPFVDYLGARRVWGSVPITPHG